MLNQQSIKAELPWHNLNRLGKTGDNFAALTFFAQHSLYLGPVLDRAIAGSSPKVVILCAAAFCCSVFLAPRSYNLVERLGWFPRQSNLWHCMVVARGTSKKMPLTMQVFKSTIGKAVQSFELPKPSNTMWNLIAEPMIYAWSGQILCQLAEQWKSFAATGWLRGGRPPSQLNSSNFNPGPPVICSELE